MKRAGFTVIELVGVITILAILLASIVGSYLGWGRAGALDGASGALLSGLAQAREIAITQRETVGVICGNTAPPGRAARGYFVLAVVTNAQDTAVPYEYDLAPTNYLPGNVLIGETFPQSRKPVILFTPEGVARLPAEAMTEGIPYFKLTLPRGDRPLYRHISVDPLTGIATLLQEDPQP
jgi:Tfp pilus assembly protein FimT